MKNNELKQKIYKVPVLLVMFVIGLFTMAKYDPKNVTASNLDKISVNNQTPKAKISRQFKLFTTDDVTQKYLAMKYVNAEMPIVFCAINEHRDNDKNLIWNWEVDENGLYIHLKK
jgi:LAS superfamily LD-carboxypeptidase LdcB